MRSDGLPSSAQKNAGGQWFALVSYGTVSNCVPGSGVHRWASRDGLRVAEVQHSTFNLNLEPYYIPPFLLKRPMRKWCAASMVNSEKFVVAPRV